MTGAGKKTTISNKSAKKRSFLPARSPKPSPESKITREIPTPIKNRKKPKIARKIASKVPNSPQKAPLGKDLATTKVSPRPTLNRPKATSKRKKLILKPSKTTKTTPKSSQKTAETEYSVEQRRREHKTVSWQNPVVNYFDRKYPNFRIKHPRPSKQRLAERRILLMLAFFSISIGLWENFRQLWLQGNGFSAADVSLVISIGTVVGSVGALLVGRFVKMSQLKRFMTIILVSRCVNFLILALLNGTSLRVVVDIFAVIDVLTSMLLLVSVYPLITTIAKSGATFSRRKLVEYLFRDIGILIGGVFIGQQLGNWVVDYNTCLLIATGFAVAAAWVMFRVDIRLTEKAPEEHFSALSYILRNKIQRNYMIYTLLAGTAYNIAVGLKMLMLTDSFEFSPGIATNYLLVAGLIADILGILALKFFTPKNAYLALTIKFGTRFVIFMLAAISDNNFLAFLALTWTILSSTAYENITDGCYINSVDNRYQLKYNTIRYVIHHLGIALGTFLCGQVFQYGPGAIFALSGFVILFQLAAGFYLIYLRQHRTNRRAQAQLLDKKRNP